MKICPFCLKPNATGKCMNRNCAAGTADRSQEVAAALPVHRQLVRVK